MAKRTEAGISPILQHESRLMWVVLLAAIMIVVLHSYGAFAPSGDNWGFHQLAFLPLVLRIIILVLMASILLPSIQKRILQDVSASAEHWRQIPNSYRKIILAVLFVMSGSLLWFFREGTTFLGDGQIFIHTLPKINQADSVHTLYDHEPLFGYIVWTLYHLLPSQDPVAMSRFAYQLISIVCGLLFLVVLFVFVRELSKERIVRVLAYLSVIVLGTSQLFFGYLENYSPAFLGLFAYLTFSLMYVRRKIPLVIPSAVFGFSFVLSFGTIAFLPTLVILYWLSSKRRELFATLLALGVTIAVVAFSLWLCCYPLSELLTLFGSESHLIPLTHLTSGWQGYTLFSMHHLLDVANFQLLVAPLALIVLGAVTVLRFKTIPWRSSEWIVLFTAGVCAVGIIFVFNCDIGMSRDWDLLSTFSPGLIVAVTYALVHFSPASEQSRRILIIIIIITGLHSVAWVGVNSDDQRAMNRFGVLMQNSLWGSNAYKVHDELATYCRERGDQSGEIEHYKNYLSVDSTNPRVLAGVGAWYWNRGDMKQAVPYLERAAAAGSTNAQVYMNLAVYYAKGGRFSDALAMTNRTLAIRPDQVEGINQAFLSLADSYAKSGRFSDALAMTKNALAINPNQAEAVNTAGACILRLNESFKEALQYFLAAIRLDPNFPPAYLNAGLCYEQIGNRDLMVQYLSNYLRIAPDDPAASSVRRKLASVEKRY